MQNLDFNLFSIIAAYLSNKSIETLAISTSTLLKKISKVLAKVVKSEKPMVNAILSKNVDVVSVLIKAGYDPTINNNYSIRLAVRYGHTEIVRLLLQDLRVDPAVDNNYAIRIASSEGHTEIVRLLLQDPRVDS